MKTYELFKDKEELKVAEKIQQRRYQVLVHSCLYYQMNSNIISDSKWDKWAQELDTLQKKFPSIAEQVRFAEEFKNWSPATGFDLPINRQDILELTKRVANLFGIVTSKKEVKPIKPIKKSTGGKRRLF